FFCFFMCRVLIFLLFPYTTLFRSVGFVVFIILVIIQFIVITKGAERVSEVSARFTLDAMPGKQMSIDADMNAGLISASILICLRSEEHTSELQSRFDLVCRLLLEK